MNLEVICNSIILFVIALYCRFWIGVVSSCVTHCSQISEDSFISSTGLSLQGKNFTDEAEISDASLFPKEDEELTRACYLPFISSTVYKESL